jgi:hypothetical protein
MSEEWSECLIGHHEQGIQMKLLIGSRADRPAGSAQFVESLEKLTGRDLAVGKMECPASERREK